MKEPTVKELLVSESLEQERGLADGFVVWLCGRSGQRWRGSGRGISGRHVEHLERARDGVDVRLLVPRTSMHMMAGGWGRLSTVTLTPPDDSPGVAVWDISKKSVLNYSLPEDHPPDPWLGVSRTHAWVGARVGGSDPYLMRFKVE